MINGTGVTARRSEITCSMMGEGSGGGDDSGCGAGGRGYTGAVWNSTGSERGESGADSRISASAEGRGDESEAGFGFKIASTSSCSLDICTSSSLVSRGNLSSNKAEARRHSGITTSTAGGGTITASTGSGSGGGGGSMFRIEAGLGGRSVGTYKLDDESEMMEVGDVGGGSAKDDDDITIDASSVVGGGDSSRASTPTGGVSDF